MLSDDWKVEAIRRFPEIEEAYREDWDNPYLCWTDLSILFDDFYKPPRNDDGIARIYAFADWCLKQPAGQSAEDDLGNCVAVNFFEHIPQCEEAMKDMPRWFSIDDVIATRDVFSHLVGPEGFQRILEVYKHTSLQLRQWGAV